MTENDEFDKKLLTEDNPFKYPDPPSRPPFMVGGEEYLRWFENTFEHSIKHGYSISFIVGEPGAGKSHFLRYLDYLFYEANKFRGIYAIYNARHEEIEEKDLWLQLLFNNDAIHKLRQILSIAKIQSFPIRQDIKTNIISLLNGSLEIKSLDPTMLHQIGETLSELLVHAGAGMCIAIDNIDEHFRYLSDKYGKEKALEKFFGMLRSLTAGVRQILILLACTTPVYSEIKSVTVDRTHARRIEFQEQTLKELTLPQSFQLVHNYLNWWAEKHGVSVPMHSECIVDDEDMSIYPFSKTAIEYFYKVTARYAGDIVLVCCECINDMKSEGKVLIVKDELIFYALEKAFKRRPQIISKIDILKKDRLKILEKLLDKKLKEIESRIRQKYSAGIEHDVLIDRVEAFVEMLGIRVNDAPAVINYYNPSRLVSSSEYLKIWQYRDKKIAVKYIIGDKPPIGSQERPTYFRQITLQDIVDIGSLIEANEATHGLFALYWAGEYAKPLYKIWEQKNKFGPILDEIVLDDHIFKIIGVVEEGEDDKNDLATYVDNYYLRLVEKLDRLIEQKPPEGRKEDDFPPIRYF